MAEFSIIEEFCQDIGPDQAETILTIGDDAAIVAVPEGMELAISVDTMVSGVHFFPDVSPAKLAHKILAVNLSDMAAMGAKPKWATMALTIPELDKNWLKAFSDALKVTAERFDVQIIGGDTSRGPLNISLTIMGLSPKFKALRRSGAIVDDDVYVSSNLGDAALGLAVLLEKVTLADDHQRHVIAALETPAPRVTLGQELVGVASSCVDISDGLVGDLAHISELSGLSIQINIELVPLSKPYQSYIASGGSFDLALNGGDDYELAFTASRSHRERIANISQKQGISLSRIGCVTKKGKQAVDVRHNGVRYELADGFEHFS